MEALNLPRYSDNKIFKQLKEVTDIARNLKAMGISVDVIAQGTGLSVDDVKAIGVTSFPNANCQE
jgi:hypothetical protein